MTLNPWVQTLQEELADELLAAQEQTLFAGIRCSAADLFYRRYREFLTTYQPVIAEWERLQERRRRIEKEFWK